MPSRKNSMTNAFPPQGIGSATTGMGGGGATSNVSSAANVVGTGGGIHRLPMKPPYHRTSTNTTGIIHSVTGIPPALIPGSVLPAPSKEYMEALSVISEETMTKACQLLVSDRDYQLTPTTSCHEKEVEKSQQDKVVNVDDPKNASSSSTNLNETTGTKKKGVKSGNEKSDLEQLEDLVKKCQRAAEIIRKEEKEYLTKVSQLKLSSSVLLGMPTPQVPMNRSGSMVAAASRAAAAAAGHHHLADGNKIKNLKNLTTTASGGGVGKTMLPPNLGGVAHSRRTGRVTTLGTGGSHAAANYQQQGLGGVTTAGNNKTPLMNKPRPGLDREVSDSSMSTVEGGGGRTKMENSNNTGPVFSSTTSSSGGTIIKPKGRKLMTMKGSGGTGTTTVLTSPGMSERKKLTLPKHTNLSVSTTLFTSNTTSANNSTGNTDTTPTTTTQGEGGGGEEELPPSVLQFLAQLNKDPNNPPPAATSTTNSLSQNDTTNSEGKRNLSSHPPTNTSNKKRR